MKIKDLPRPEVYTKKTFFSLLMSRYATGVTPELITRFEGDPGTKRNTWKGDAGWLGIDEWRTSTLGDGSNGTTSIYQNNALVWEMQYGGSYPKRVIPFLRQALLLNYSKNSWHGGRGPKKYSDGNYRYFNDIVDGKEFAWFDGIETIEECVDGTWQRVGAHYYGGGYLY